jgi:hypothetical protein
LYIVYMKVGRFTIQGEDCCFEIINFIETELKIDYKSSITDGNIFFTEDFSIMNSSDLMIVISVQKINNSENQCAIEIVAGGGGEGLFSFTFGNEKRRLNKASDLIYGFCQRNKFKISEG